MEFSLIRRSSTCGVEISMRTPSSPSSLRWDPSSQNLIWSAAHIKYQSAHFMDKFQVHVEELDNQALIILSQNTPNLRLSALAIESQKKVFEKPSLNIRSLSFSSCGFVEPGGGGGGGDGFQAVDREVFKIRILELVELWHIVTNALHRLGGRRGSRLQLTYGLNWQSWKLSVR